MDLNLYPSNYFAKFHFSFQHEEQILKHTWPQTKSNNQHFHKYKLSRPCKLTQTLFQWGAYTESDNAPARK